VPYKDERGPRPASPKVRGGSFISIFDLVALLLTLAALFSWLNHRLLGLPHSIGLLGLGLLASLALVGVERVVPDASLAERLTNGLRQINFTDVVMNGMLAFLLFAGVLSLNLEALRDRAWPVGVLAVVGTVISTGLVGSAFWLRLPERVANTGRAHALLHLVEAVWPAKARSPNPLRSGE
jgi:NhaP-type Na+/H+ or K+/H+ antiporter